MSRDRLARRMRAEVADVRMRLEEAVLRTDALLASGQPERAAAVLDEQHALLAELQDTLASAVAAASVEADAEAVLVGSADGAELFGSPQQPPTPAVPAPDRRDEPGIRRSARTTASALVSAMAALALLVVAAPTPSPRTLASSDVDDALLRADAGPTALEATGGAGGVTAPEARGRFVGPNEREVRRFFTSPTASDRRDAAGPSDGLPFGLSELQALVDQFVATVVRAAGGLSADPADAPAAPAPRRPGPAERDGVGDATVPSGEPATTSSEPTGADAGDDASGDPAEAPSLPPLPSSDAPAEDGATAGDSATAGDGATAEEDAPAEEPPAEEAPAEEAPAEEAPAEEEAPTDDGTSTGEGGTGSGVPALE